jgi:predicted DNA-binding protein
MAGLKIHIRKDLEERFREAAMRRFGYKKGALSKAAEEAIEKWLNSIEDVKFEGDPVEAIKGILSEVKMNSVDLQHLAKKLWFK